MIRYTIDVPTGDPADGWSVEAVDTIARAILDAAAAMIAHHLIDMDLPSDVVVSIEAVDGPDPSRGGGVTRIRGGRQVREAV